jgi:hypothetical protein
MRLYTCLYLLACLTLSFISSACRSPRANLEFSPAMAQTFEVFIEKPTDTNAAKQYGEIEGYMMSTIAQNFARQGLSARILTNPAEHKPGPNSKLLVIKLISYTRIGVATTLGIQVTLKEGSTVLTSWQDSVQTSRPWQALVNALNLKIGANLKKYYAPAAPAPAQVPVAPGPAPVQ